MPLIKTIEVATSSTISIDDAIRNAVKEVSRTVRNLDTVEVKNIKASVKDGAVSSFDIVCHISFRIDSRD